MEAERKSQSIIQQTEDKATAEANEKVNSIRDELEQKVREMEDKAKMEEVAREKSRQGTTTPKILAFIHRSKVKIMK